LCSFLKEILLKKILFILKVTIFLSITSSAHGDEHPVLPSELESNWSDMESVLAKALSIHLKLFETKTGIILGTNLNLRVSLEQSIGRGAAAEYRAEKETIYFPIAMTYILAQKYNKPLWLLDPTILTKELECILSV
jgi:hypothetical protein